MKTVTFNGAECSLEFLQYANGNPALQLWHQGMPEGHLAQRPQPLRRPFGLHFRQSQFPLFLQRVAAAGGGSLLHRSALGWPPSHLWDGGAGAAGCPSVHDDPLFLGRRLSRSAAAPGPLP